MKKIAIFIGTRPDSLKFIPIIKELNNYNIHYKIIVSGQHTTLIEKVLNEFSITADYKFTIKRQSLNEFSGKYLLKLSALLEREKFDLSIVQGDTTTAVLSALSSFYRGITVFHVEAGLRSGDIYNPFPEEINRKIIGQIATLHFAPSLQAKKNLQREGILANDIIITGNTIIDLVKTLSKNIKREYKYILITLHRRENWGLELKNMCYALKKISNKFKSYKYIFPIHPNPIVKSGIEKILKNSNINLVNPMDYVNLITVLKKSKLVITDSGGIQEEAGYLGIPIVILRKKTERPEIIQRGVGILAGTNREKIFSILRNILSNESVYNNMNGKRVYSYGRGYASKKIVKAILNY